MGRGRPQSQAVPPRHTHPKLRPVTLETWSQLNLASLESLPTRAAGAVNAALFDQPPRPAALSHTVVESSRLFSGYGGALRGSFVCLWWGYGGGLRPLRPCAGAGLGPEHTCEGL